MEEVWVKFENWFARIQSKYSLLDKKGWAANAFEAGWQSAIKRAPTPFGKTDSELAQEYRNWFLGSRLNLKAAEQSFAPDPETGVAKSDNESKLPVSGR